MNNTKVSVIIPTVQKNLDILYKLVTVLAADDCVSEIMIINNGAKNLPKTFYIDKVKMFKTPQNLYVNGSWNFGVANASNDIFLIINDDILPVKNLCSLVLKTKILEKEDTGLVGICQRSINQYNIEDASKMEIPNGENHKLEFLELMDYRRTRDWGSAFFGKKSNYHKIPDDLKIIYGDNYLLYRNKKRKKINYQISGLTFNHVHSLSSSAEEFSEIVANDIGNSKKYVPEYMNE